MRESLTKYNMHNVPGADIHGVHIPEAELKRLAEMVETVNNIHSRAVRMDAANAAGLASASVERSPSNYLKTICIPPINATSQAGCTPAFALSYWCSHGCQTAVFPICRGLCRLRGLKFNAIFRSSSMFPSSHV